MPMCIHHNLGSHEPAGTRWTGLDRRDARKVRQCVRVEQVTRSPTRWVAGAVDWDGARHCHSENVGSELFGGFHASLLSALFTSPAAHRLLSRPRPLQSQFVPTSIVKSSFKSFSQAVHPSISSVRRVSALILHCSRDCFPPLFHSQCAFKSLSDASDGSTEPQHRETAAPPPYAQGSSCVNV